MASAEEDVSTQTIGVVGAGRLGAALARALTAAGYPVVALASSDGARAASLARELGAAVRAVSTQEMPRHAAWLFLAVPDAQLARVCDALPVGSGHCVVHTSGAQGLVALQSAAAAGARVGVFHPLQSFAHDAPPEVFRAITIGIEADGPLQDMLLRCCERLGAHALSLRGVDRPRYHAAAVFASNYVVALHVAAARAWALAGLDPAQAQAALAPLTLGAAQNLLKAPLSQALTGPVARGDAATVEHHLLALCADEQLVQLYRALGQQLLQLALPLSPDAHARLQACLTPESALKHE